MMSQQSIESEVSATSSSQRDRLSERSESTSDVSTICGDSDTPAQRDDVFSDDAHSSCDKQEINKETGETDLKDSSTISTTSLDENELESCKSQPSCSSSPDHNASVKNNNSNCDIIVSQSNQDTVDLERSESKDKCSAVEPKPTLANTCTSTDSHHVRINQTTEHVMSENRGQSSRTLTYHHIYPQEGDHSEEDAESSPSACNSPQDPSPQHACAKTNKMASSKQVYNPFPSQHMSQRRAQNGVKLGLYSADNLPKFELGMMRGRPLQTIGRQQINACLHRQYMAEVKSKFK